ncbi:MAG: electron transfer flavoprotein subunit beta/FixA family protein [Bacillota bacterium]
MDILVCFKVVPDLDQLAGSDWFIDSLLRVETGYAKTILNAYDESALEMALRFSESAGQSVNLTALTIGDEKADIYLKTLYALQFAKAVRIENSVEARFSPEAVASVICRYVELYGKQDLLIMGRQSGVGDNAKTPLLAAEMLKWPCITQVTRVEPGEASRLKVTAMVDGGLVQQTVRTPCVLAVGNVPNAYLRVPTLKEKYACGKKEIEVMDLEQFGLQGIFNCFDTGCELQGLALIDRNREGVIVQGATPAEKARALYDAYLKEWLEQL